MEVEEATVIQTQLPEDTAEEDLGMFIPHQQLHNIHPVVY